MFIQTLPFVHGSVYTQIEHSPCVLSMIVPVNCWLVPSISLLRRSSNPVIVCSFPTTCM
jgi:hypothetical protein